MIELRKNTQHSDAGPLILLRITDKRRIEQPSARCKPVWGWELEPGAA